jgi:hypothetical protein
MTVTSLTVAAVDLFWLPLGAGESGCVRWNGKLYERLVAWRAGRAAQDLYHSALEVRLGGERFVIEMGPAWGRGPHDDAVCEGPVGLGWLSWAPVFRYEVRRSQDGSVADVSEAVASPQRLGTDAVLARQLLELVPEFPTLTWGRDQLGAGDMWNSNSLTSWLLARSGHRPDLVVLPPNGRAPGWSAGLAAARTQSTVGAW